MGLGRLGEAGPARSQRRSSSRSGAASRPTRARNRRAEAGEGSRSLVGVSRTRRTTATRVSLSYARRRSALSAISAPRSACDTGPSENGLPTSCQSAAWRSTSEPPARTASSSTCRMCSSTVYAWVGERCGAPTHASHSGSATASAPTSRARRSASAAASPSSVWSSVSRTRSGESPAIRGASSRISPSVTGSGTSPSRERRATPRRIRRGSSRNAVGWTARSTPAEMSSRPPKGSIHSPVRRLRAIALAVKSRRSRSSRTGPSRLGLDPEVRVRVARRSPARPRGSASRGAAAPPRRPPSGPKRGRKRTPTSRPATRSSSAGPERRRIASSSPMSWPRTRKSMSFGRLPSSSSRRLPPTS